jgi:hypothetical protein
LEQAQTPAAQPTSADNPPKTTPVSVTGSRRSERRAASGGQGLRGSRRYTSSTTRKGEPPRLVRTNKELSAGETEELLANPTKIVTETELHTQYGYVLADIRNMGLLAGALFGMLIVLALFFVR